MRTPAEDRHPRPRMADLARLASERETTRLAEINKKREPLTRLAEKARAAQQRVLKERGWPSR